MSQPADNGNRAKAPTYVKTALLEYESRLPTSDKGAGCLSLAGQFALGLFTPLICLAGARGGIGLYLIVLVVVCVCARAGLKRKAFIPGVITMIFLVPLWIMYSCGFRLG